MTTQSAVLQLVFEIDSAGASNTTYVTRHASDNDLTLKIDRRGREPSLMQHRDAHLTAGRTRPHEPRRMHHRDA